MRTIQESMKRELQRYLSHGYSMKGAVFQVKALHHHRHDKAVDDAAEQLGTE